MTWPPPLWLVAVLIGVVVLTLVGHAALRAWWKRRRGRFFARRGLDSERDAERLLGRLGYRVVERQVTGRWWLDVDGEPVEVTCRADLIVKRRRKRYVAEVKSGAVRSPTAPAIRRQLLEYARTFDVDGVLLVDMGTHTVHTVRFHDIR